MYFRDARVILYTVIAMSETSEKLYALIQSRGLSYGALAELTGIPKSAVQRYATGETAKIPLERIEALAKALGVPASYLMGWEDAAPDDDRELKELLEELKNREDMRMLFKLAKGASPEDVRRAVSIIEALRRQE